jgi:hypothetical protein
MEVLREVRMVVHPVPLSSKTPYALILRGCHLTRSSKQSQPNQDLTPAIDHRYFAIDTNRLTRKIAAQMQMGFMKIHQK